MDPPAFTTVQSIKINKESTGQWVHTYENIKNILLKTYGDIDANFSARNQLSQLKMMHPQNILMYARKFNEISTKILDEPLTDQAKIAAFLSGIKDTRIYSDLIIEPSTGTRWMEYNKLYDYVITKYSALRQQIPGTKDFTRTNPRTYSSPKPRRPRTHLATLSNFRSSRRPRLQNNWKPRRPFGNNQWKPPQKTFPTQTPPDKPRTDYPEDKQKPYPPRNDRPFRSGPRPRFPPKRRMNNFKPTHFNAMATKRPNASTPEKARHFMNDNC